MPPEPAELDHVRRLAIAAGLVVRAADLDAFVAGYEPVRCRGFALPPAFVWLCRLCELDQLARVWVLQPVDAGAAELEAANAAVRADPEPWPEYLVAFAFTGDDVFCFAYNGPDDLPAVVVVDAYAPADENGERAVDWDWYADDFVGWLARQAAWLPESDARMARRR